MGGRIVKSSDVLCVRGRRGVQAGYEREAGERMRAPHP